jgi:hypothetical protein
MNCLRVMNAAKKRSNTAEHAVPADRFAREIGRFLTSAFAARSRQLNGRSLGGNHQYPSLLGATLTAVLQLPSCPESNPAC